MKDRLTIAASLPEDLDRATLVGRVWKPGGGPVPAVVRRDAVYDISALATTVSTLLEMDDVAQALRETKAWPRLGSLEAVLVNSAWNAHDEATPWFLAPCDLQAIKASGVTFVSSLLERVIEEQARGDPSKAQAVRNAMVAVIGEDLAVVRPLKEVLEPSSLFSSTLITLAPGTPSIRRSNAISGDARSSCRRCRLEPRRGPRAFSPRMAIRARPRSRHRPGHGVHNSGGD